MNARPWSSPIAVDDIPETGRHVDLVADEAARAALAKVAGVVRVSRLEAEFDLSRHGRDGVHVVGHLSATVEQNCVRTLEPIENAIEEDIDLIFSPESAVTNANGVAASGDASDEPPEVLKDGMVDLGAVTTEFLLLGIDPYPRKPGSVFDPPKAFDDPAAHPFAALAALKKPERKSGN